MAVIQKRVNILFVCECKHLEMIALLCSNNSYWLGKINYIFEEIHMIISVENATEDYTNNKFILLLLVTGVRQSYNHINQLIIIIMV